MITKDAEAEILVAEFSCRVNTSVSHVNRLQICSTMTSTWGSFLTKNERLGEFSHHKPPLLSNPIFCSFRCKEKIKSSVEKILVAIPVVVGLRQSLKRTIPSSRFFWWSFCYCGATENVGDFLGILVRLLELEVCLLVCDQICFQSFRVV